MVDKILSRVERTKANWWTHLKKASNISPNYKYYEIHENLKYRYPSPGSCEQAKYDHPNLFKIHWKTPYRESQYNLRPKEKRPEIGWDDGENWISKKYGQGLPELDPLNPHDAETLQQQEPKWDEYKVIDDGNSGAAHLDTEEKRNELWAEFDRMAEHKEYLQIENGGYDLEVDHAYNAVEHQFWDREYSGLDSQARYKTIAVELERMIEKDMGGKQIAAGKVNFYKGTIKKWQVLDDDAHEPEQIEKIQSVIQAPLPEELEMYQEKGKIPMQLPFNDENARAWRDEARANDSADFDPEFLSIDRERRKKFFIERYEQPKQLE